MSTDNASLIRLNRDTNQQQFAPVSKASWDKHLRKQTMKKFAVPSIVMLTLAVLAALCFGMSVFVKQYISWENAYNRGCKFSETREKEPDLCSQPMAKSHPAARIAVLNVVIILFIILVSATIMAGYFTGMAIKDE